MALRLRDPVAVKHPSEEGFQVVSRNAAGVMAKSGWTEDRSRDAKAAVAAATRTPSPRAEAEPDAHPEAANPVATEPPTTTQEDTDQ